MDTSECIDKSMMHENAARNTLTAYPSLQRDQRTQPSPPDMAGASRVQGHPIPSRRCHDSVQWVSKAGGRVRERGPHSPGEPQSRPIEGLPRIKCASGTLLHRTLLRHC